MSVEALAWLAQRAPGVKPHWMGTLFGLCNTADEKGVTYPAQPLLSWYARKDERAVREDLRGMEAAGLIRKGDQNRVAHLPPDRRPVVWQLAMETDRGPRPEPGKRGRPAGKRGDLQTRPEPETLPFTALTGGSTDPGGSLDPPVFDLGKQPPNGKRGGLQTRQPNLRTQELLLLKEEEQPAPSGAQELTADEQALLAEVTAAAPRWSPAAIRGVLVAAEIRQRTDRALVRLAFLYAADDRPSPGHQGTRTPRRLLKDACPFWARAERELHPAVGSGPDPVRLVGRVEWCGSDGCDSVTRTLVRPDTGVPLPGRPRCPDCHPQSPAASP